MERVTMGRLLALVCAAGLLLMTLGGTMSKAEAQYICSPMSGVLIGPDGAPASGVAVRRDWLHSGKSGSDSVTTDAEGRFALGAVDAPRKRFFSGLSTPVVVQRFYAMMPGEEVEILYINSRSLDPLHETGGAPFSVTCDMRKAPDNGPLGWGNCVLN